MKIGILTLALVGLVSTPAIAQDFDKLLFQQSRKSVPVGFQLKLPFGGAGETGGGVQLNFGISLKDKSGGYTLVPMAGYEPANGGAHLLGVSLNANEGGLNSVKASRIMGAVFLGGVAVIGLGSLGTKDDGECRDGMVLNPRTGLCEV